MTKTWKVIGKFDSFEEADKKRNDVLKSGKDVKVRRCGPGGSIFSVRVKIEETKTESPDKKKSTKNSKKLGDKRKEKRAKKKARKLEEGGS